MRTASSFHTFPSPVLLVLLAGILAAAGGAPALSAGSPGATGRARSAARTGGGGPAPRSVLSDTAYPLLHSLIAANRSAFYVYRDAASGFNHGFPSGVFGTSGKLQVDAAAVDDPASPEGVTTDPNRLDRIRGTVLRVAFARLAGTEFAGLHIQEPETLRPGASAYDLSGASRVVFEVRSPTAGGVSVKFGVGGRLTPMHVEQSAGFVEKSISFSELQLSAGELRDVHLLFTVQAEAASAPNGGTVLIDNVRFDPVPAAQTSGDGTLSFPLANQAFGAVPAAAEPFPPDQVVPNLTTIYESALVGTALLGRGTAEDLAAARHVADAFVYALANENQGNPIPGTTDARGLHNGYSNGDLPLRNDQAGGARAGQVRLAGFQAGSTYRALLDGATGGNNAFVVLTLVAAYRQFTDPRYLDASRTLCRWIAANLADTTGTGFGGYYLGYPDDGLPKTLLLGKSIENNADIFAAFTALAKLERDLGNAADAELWTGRANAAGDFVMAMYNPAQGRFYAGTVPAGTGAGPGVTPDGPRQGNDVVNTFDFLDAQTFPILALAPSERYSNVIDWRSPVRHALRTYRQGVTAAGQQFQGFNLVSQPVSGPNGIAWEFTAQVIPTMRLVDQLYQQTTYREDAAFYQQELRRAQTLAPFADGAGIVASTLQAGDTLPPRQQSLHTPFQRIAERVGLAATVWGILADRNLNVFTYALTTPLPAAPSDLAATAEATTRVRLAWRDNATNESGYRLERRTGTGEFAEVAALPSGAAGYLDETVTENTTYVYRVRAVNGGGASAYSGEVSVTTPQEPPAAPTALRAAPLSATQIRLTWQDNSRNEAAFRIERRSGGAFALVAGTGPDVVSYDDGDLTPHTSYTYRVQAVNGGGDSAFTGEATAATPPLPPSAPENLSVAVFSSASLRLTWSDTSDNEDGFRIERRSGDGEYAPVATSGPNSTAYDDSTVSPGVSYRYRVRAFNSGGESESSNEAAAVPVDPALASFRLTPRRVRAGREATGTVRLTAGATVEGTAVTLRTSSPRSVSLPASITVSPGQTTATFNVRTFAGRRGGVVTVTAKLNGVKKRDTLRITPSGPRAR